MKSSLKYLFPTLMIILSSCHGKSNSTNTSFKSSDNLSVILPSLSNSVQNDSSNVLSQNENKYHLDENLIGKWYIHSNNMGLLNINTEFEIYKNNTLIIQNIHFNYVGIYLDYDETAKFISDSGITTFIVSYNDGSVDWAFSDINGQNDFGYAMNTPLQIGFNYDYIGNNWPMEMINDWLDAKGSIPPYPNTNYYLLNGISQLYDAKYSMIDIFNAPSTALQDYIDILLKNNFIQEEDVGDFKVFLDSNKIFKLRIIYFTSESNLSIFVYNNGVF